MCVGEKARNVLCDSWAFTRRAPTPSTHWCFFFAAGIAAVGGITAVGEWARNFVLGLRAPLLQSLIVAHYLPPFASTYTLGFGMASD